jgi:HEPN domain-containing protein
MNPLTLEWVQKAEVDFESAQLLSQSPNDLHDAVCFHAQQCIEKYLKAWLQEASVRIPRTHDLEDLLDLMVPGQPAWDAWRPDFLILTTHAVESRYPGKSATLADAQHACQVSLGVRAEIRASLGLF